MRHRVVASLLVGGLCLLRPLPSLAQVEEVRIAVDGLTCNLCAAGLERSLRTLDNVASVQVSMQDESAVVKMKAGAGFDIEKIRGSVTNAGQQARRFDIKVSGAVRREDGRYSLQPTSGAPLLIARRSAARLEPHVGRVVRVQGTVSSPPTAPLELELTDVVLR
jgi:copper chaperone CopZ